MKIFYKKSSCRKNSLDHFLNFLSNYVLKEVFFKNKNVFSRERENDGLSESLIFTWAVPPILKRNAESESRN